MAPRIFSCDILIHNLQIELLKKRSLKIQWLLRHLLSYGDFVLCIDQKYSVSTVTHLAVCTTALLVRSLADYCKGPRATSASAQGSDHVKDNDEYTASTHTAYANQC